MPARLDTLAPAPVSYCPNCASVQPTIRVYWWEMLGAWFCTCAGCKSDVALRASA